MATGLEQVVIKDFTGGLNTQDGPFNLRPNEAQDLLNVTLTQRGALAQRLGSVQFDASGIDSPFVHHMRPWYFASTRLMMVSADGDIFSGTTAGAFTSRVDGTAASTWWFEQMADVAGANFLFCANGVDAARKIDTALAVTNWTDATGSVNLGTGTQFMRVWKNRMVAFNVNEPRRLRFSDIANPNSFPDNNFQDVMASEDDLDPITWIEILGDLLLVFKRRSVWAVSGDVPNLILRRIGDPGCEARFQSAVSEGRVYYWGRNGVWSTDGIAPPRMETRKIENFIADNMNHTSHAMVRLYAGRDRRVFAAVRFGSATDGNTHLIEILTSFDIQDAPGETGSPEADTRDIRHPVVVHDLQVGAMCTFRAGDVDEVYGAFGDGPGVFRLFDGTNDEMVLSGPDAIAARWKSAWFPIRSEEPYERLRRLNVLGSGDAVVNVYKDFQEGVAFAATLDTGIASDPLWGGGVWDGTSWDPGPATALATVRPESRARYHAFEFSNEELDESFVILSVELKFRGGKEH